MPAAALCSSGARKPVREDAAEHAAAIRLMQAAASFLIDRQKLPVRIVEGFRASVGVLNPDVYDPRSRTRWALGIWDSGAVW